jgi:AcrR family transcriptional regulator
MATRTADRGGATAGRPRVTREEVLRTAEGCVDERGWDGWAMADLAAELGVRAPSLYTHVRGVDDVRAELQRRAIRQLGAELRQAAMGRTGDDGLRVLADTLRAFAHRHPRRYEGMTRAAVDPEALPAAAADASEALASMMRGLDADDETLTEIQAATFAALHGAVSLEISGFLGRDVNADRVWSRVVEATISLVHRAPDGP